MIDNQGLSPAQYGQHGSSPPASPVGQAPRRSEVCLSDDRPNQRRTSAGPTEQVSAGPAPFGMGKTRRGKRGGRFAGVRALAANRPEYEVMGTPHGLAAGNGELVELVMGTLTELTRRHPRAYGGIPGVPEQQAGWPF